MAKKPVRKSPPTQRPADASTSKEATVSRAEAALAAPVDEQGSPLLEEVQTFLSRRDDLARRLAAEIDATEKRLVELRKTATALFPGTKSGGSNNSNKDRKSKPAKAKPAPRPAPIEDAPSVGADEPPTIT